MKSIINGFFNLLIHLEVYRYTLKINEIQFIIYIFVTCI